MMRLLITIFLCFSGSFTIAQNWYSVNNGLNGVIGYLNVHPISNELYVSGIITNVDSIVVNNIIKYTGENWIQVDSNIVNYVYQFEEYKGKLFAIGRGFIAENGDTIDGIAELKGENWSTVGDGFSENVLILDLKVFDDELYICGSFNVESGSDTLINVAKWDGIKWSRIDSGINFLNTGLAQTMEVYNNALYIGGSIIAIIDSDTSANLIKWDGTNGGGLDIVAGGTIIDMAVFNDELYVGGLFNTVLSDTIRYIVRWNGQNWNSVGTGVDTTSLTNPSLSPSPGVYAIKKYNERLYIGGRFDIAGNDTVNNIAKWDGMNWSGLGTGVKTTDFVFYDDPIVFAMEVYDNELYIGGSFILANDDSVNNIAKWNSCDISTPNANFAQSSDTLDLKDTSIVFFSSTDTLAQIWDWNFSDGTVDSIANPLHFFDTVGNYTITLITYNNECTDTSSSVVAVVNTTGFGKTISSNEFVSLYPNPATDKITLQWDRSNFDVDEIKIYNRIGQILWVEAIYNNGYIELDVSPFPRGIYFCQLTSSKGNFTQTKKIVVFQ